MRNKGYPAGAVPITDGIIFEAIMELKDVCSIVGAKLSEVIKEQFPNFHIEGPRLLWAISGVESTYGTDKRTRFEKSLWDRWSNTKDARLQRWISEHKTRIVTSFGPWQILGVVALELGFDENLSLYLLILPEVSA